MRKPAIILVSLAALLIFSAAAYSDCDQGSGICAKAAERTQSNGKGFDVVASSKDPTKQEVVIDPVCGMDVEVKGAKYSYKYKDKTYYFCNKSCKDNFAKDPAKYIGKEHKKPGTNGGK